MPSRSAPLVGAHVPVTGGLATGALARAHKLGAESLQVFVGNPRGWALTAGDPGQDETFRERCREKRIPAMVHAPYLVNLGSPTPSTLERSVASVRHNLTRAAQIGAHGVVVHTGSYVGGSYDQAMRQVADALLPLLDELDDDGPALILEPTAGQGNSLCAGIEDLPAYLDSLEEHPKLGVCLDTCHVFAAGCELDVRGGMTATLNRLAEVAGPGRLHVIHANDSRAPRGSFRDRHERIGRGHIGESAFRALLRHPSLRGLPVIIETPGGHEACAEDVALLKRIRRR